MTSPPTRGQSVQNKRELSLEDRLAVCEQVARLVKAQLPIAGELSKIANGMSGSSAELAKSVDSELAQGKQLSDILAGDASSESRVLAACITAGEASDCLDHALHCWSSMHLANQRATQRLRSAMVYPTALIFITVASLVYVIWSLIPEYRVTYALFDQDLPAWLSAIVWLRDRVGFVLLAIVLLASLIAALWTWRKQRNKTHSTSHGSAADLRLQALASEVAAMMLKAQVALNRTSHTSAAAAGGTEEEIENAFEKIRNQKPAHPLNRESSMLMSALHAGLIPVAEVAQELLHLASHFRESADIESARRARWLPMLVALCVGTVTILTYACLIYLPWIWLLQKIVSPEVSAGL